MKITVRFDAFDLLEALTDAAIESLPEDVFDGPPGGLLEAREDRYREALAPWIDSSGQDSATYRIEVEFDTEAGTARVLRRDGKDDAERDSVEHSLLLATAALAALAENPAVYPAAVIRDRVKKCRRALALTESGRRLLAEAGR